VISKSIYEECMKMRNNLKIDWIDWLPGSTGRPST
jgi:hypothetical protein